MNPLLTTITSAPLPLANALYAFQESNAPGKIIVIVLFIGSIFAWSIMIHKYLELRRSQLESERFLAAFRKQAHPVSIYVERRACGASPLYEIYKAACSSISEELEWRRTESPELFDEDDTRCLSKRQVDAVGNMVDRTTADQLLLVESYMGHLATAVSASPFLGLLGTVWGVMAAFGGMAVAGSSTLSAVAPGIAGALLTTVVGLLVALPSSVGYNMLTSQIRGLHVQMDNFAQELMAEVPRAFLVD